GQTPARADSDISIRPSVQRPVEAAQVDGFASVHEVDADGSKNSKLSHSHAGLDAWTDRKHGNGAQSDSGTPEAPSNDPGPFPESLLRHRCDHCGSQAGITNPYDWPGRPDGIWLHPRCEAPWFVSGGRPQ